MDLPDETFSWESSSSVEELLSGSSTSSPSSFLEFSGPLGTVASFIRFWKGLALPFMNRALIMDKFVTEFEVEPNFRTTKPVVDCGEKLAVNFGGLRSPDEVEGCGRLGPSFEASRL